MAVFCYEKDADDIVTVTMNMTGPVNAMNDEYLLAMEDTLARLESEPDLRGVVLASAKKTFFAGGDIGDMIAASPDQYDLFYQRLVTTKTQLRRLELLPVPVVAAINGAALGGGFEICLVCNHRIVFDTPKAVVGLPEITLGLLPGGGGTVRLIRLLGIQKALPLLLQGQPHTPQQALVHGLVDLCVAQEERLLPQAKAWILSPHAVSQQPWQKDGYAIPGGDAGTPAVAAFLHRCSRETLAATRGLLPAPENLIDLAGRSTLLPLDGALDLESQVAARLTLSAQAKNIMTARFLHMNVVRRAMQRHGDAATTKVRRIGLVGPGGSGMDCARMQALAVAALANGVQVVCGSARARMLLLEAAAGNAGNTSNIALGKMIDVVDTQEKAKKSPACDLIVDFRTGSAGSGLPLRYVLAGHGVYIVVNAVDGVRRIAERRGYPVFKAFLHMTDLSIVFAELAPEAGSGAKKVGIKLALPMEFFRRIGVIAIAVNDAEHGFVARVVSAYEDEGRRLLDEDIGADEIARQAWKLGMTRIACDPGSAVDRFSPGACVENDIQDRLLFRQAIAAIVCLEQGIVSTVADANVATFLAAGAPAWTGGYLQMINTYGINRFVARALALTRRYGDRFSPPDLLTGNLTAGTGFY